MLPNLPFAPLSSNVTLIGIHGKAGSGKDTLATYIREHIWNQDPNNSVFILPFAAPLKSVTAELFGFPLLLCNDRTEKEEKLERIPYSPRKLLQWVGTELVRNNVDPDFWIKRLSWEIAERTQDCTKEHNVYFIIPDVRFNNEAKWIISDPRNRLAVVNRPEATGNVGLENHASEAGIPEVYAYTYLIQNTGTLEDLNQAAKTFVNSL